MARKLTMQALVIAQYRERTIVSPRDWPKLRIILEDSSARVGDQVTLVWIDGKYQIAKEKAA
jgi:hypothetical protein